MTTRTNTGRHLTAAAAILAGSLIGVSALSAQDAASETRWQPWLGCWAPAAAIGTTRTATICVVPAGGSAVDLVTVTDAKVSDRERIDASGVRHDVTKDGCSGWEQASFAPGAARVYLRSELVCSGVTRKTNGVLAFDANGQWLDVRGIAAGAQTGVRVIHYRDAVDSLELPAELASARSHQTLETSTTRIAATAPITLADIVDASNSLDARVVQAWLIEHGGEYKISAPHLVELAKAGVPGSVTDLLVALSYPRQFAVGLAMRGGEVRPASGQVAVAEAGAREIPVYLWGSGAFGRDYYGYSRYSPFGYGYSPYGYGYGYGNPYGWYGGGTPIVIVPRSPDATVGGRAIKGRGYTRSGGTSTGGQATPRSSWSGRESTGSTSQSSGGSAATSSGTSGSSTGRTAQPRKP